MRKGDAKFCCWLLLVVLAGCSSEAPMPAVVAPQADPVETVQITDRLDRTVEIRSGVKRIISLSPATTELLFALDLGPSIVGATAHCDYPEAALAIPRVGSGTLESISLESIVAAQPDLVLCKWDYHQPLVDSLDRLQIPVLAIGPQNLEELFEEAMWLGQITDRDAMATDFVARMRSRRDHLVRVASLAKPDPSLSVFYEIWDDPLMTAGPNTFIDELLTLAGLDNVIDDTQIRYPRISAELVLRTDPDLILAPTTHFEDVDVSTIAARPGWDTVKAVQQQRIHLISGDQVSRCGPRVLDALAEIILAAYPNVRPEEVNP